MTLLLSDPRFLNHNTGQHVETSGRLRAIDARLRKAGLTDRCTPLPFGSVTASEIELVHDATVLAELDSLAAHGGGHTDPDTVVSPQSPDVARLAAGACCAAVDAVLAGQDRTALCLVRPPGHHATPDRSMGFCLLNNVAIAARHALGRHNLSRVLIVDWDVHHGNGTQDVFYADPRVMFVSIHRYGMGFYPGTGAADETGIGRGLGFTRNVALPFGTPRGLYLAEFTQALEECAEKIRPELVLVSAGFDAHQLDPIGSLGLETDDFRVLTKQVMDIAATHCQGRLVSCLEGGYHLHALAESVEAHLETLLAVGA